MGGEAGGGGNVSGLGGGGHTGRWPVLGERGVTRRAFLDSSLMNLLAVT